MTTHSEAERIASALAAHGSGFALVAIDGPGGAGKSTLASSLASILESRATIVHGDDFYRPMAPKNGCG